MPEAVLLFVIFDGEDAIVEVGGLAEWQEGY